jgi:uncharacterized protein (DUF2267 family)
MNAHQLRRLAGRVAGAIAEMNEAQRRMMLARASLDRYTFQPDEPPDTYDEFLARTSGLLRHEPPASRRTDRGDGDQRPSIR